MKRFKDYLNEKLTKYGFIETEEGEILPEKEKFLCENTYHMRSGKKERMVKKYGAERLGDAIIRKYGKNPNDMEYSLMVTYADVNTSKELGMRLRDWRTGKSEPKETITYVSLGVAIGMDQQELKEMLMNYDDMQLYCLELEDAMFLAVINPEIRQEGRLTFSSFLRCREELRQRIDETFTETRKDRKGNTVEVKRRRDDVSREMDRHSNTRPIALELENITSYNQFTDLIMRNAFIFFYGTATVAREIEEVWNSKGWNLSLSEYLKKYYPEKRIAFQKSKERLRGIGRDWLIDFCLCLYFDEDDINQVLHRAKMRILEPESAELYFDRYHRRKSWENVQRTADAQIKRGNVNPIYRKNALKFGELRRLPWRQRVALAICLGECLLEAQQPRTVTGRDDENRADSHEEPGAWLILADVGQILNVYISDNSKKRFLMEWEKEVGQEHREAMKHWKEELKKPYHTIMERYRNERDGIWTMCWEKEKPYSWKDLKVFLWVFPLYQSYVCPYYEKETEKSPLRVLEVCSEYFYAAVLFSLFTGRVYSGCAVEDKRDFNRAAAEIMSEGRGDAKPLVRLLARCFEDYLFTSRTKGAVDYVEGPDGMRYDLEELVSLLKHATGCD